MYKDPSGRSFILACLIICSTIYAIAGAVKASETCDKLEITGWEKFGYILSGFIMGDLLVVKNHWDEVSKTIDIKDYNFKFDENPYYSFWTASLYANYLKENDYKNIDSRTRLGLYLELQAHYIFYLFKNSHAIDGCYMGPDLQVDKSACLCESIASILRNAIVNVPIKPVGKYIIKF